jgi:hypothetical protein
MKPILLIASSVVMACVTCTSSLAADGEAASPKRVGIYDSRVLAYAHFWSEPQTMQRDSLLREAREAQAQGNTNRLAELKRQIKQHQDSTHLQVFSSAPVDEVLASIHDRVAQVQKETGVSLLISKWDNVALKKHEGVEKVDVTDQLLGAYKMDEKQARVAAQIREKKPLPLKEAEALLREGKL